MSAKEILFQREARAQIGLGLDELANAVRVTLGPRGRNVLLESSFGSPTITKDGVTVAKAIELDAHAANLGAQMVKEVAAKTAEMAGDGTTTATVLAQAIYLEGIKLVTAGVNPMELKRGIDAGVAAMVEALKKVSKFTGSREEIAQVATISANGDDAIGNLIAEAMERVGKEGVVTIEDSQSTETSLEVVEGMSFDRGYLSPYFITDAERMQVQFQDAYVLICENRVSNMQEFVPLLEQVAKAAKPLLVIAEVDGEALATLVVNKLRGSLQVCAVKAPSFGDRRKEILKDIAVLCGGKTISPELGTKLEKLTLDELGRVKTMTADKDKTTLVLGAGKTADLESHLARLRVQLGETTSEYDRKALQSRIASLAGGVAVIRIGAATESELKERKARVEDALHATRAAVEEGVVAGGGVALLRAAKSLKGLQLEGDVQLGVDLLWKAVAAPLHHIAENAGVEGAVVVQHVRDSKGNHGYNAASGEYEDLVAAGVIDPTKVVRVALQNAASVASMMLTTEAVIVERTRAERPS